MNNVCFLKKGIFLFVGIVLLAPPFFEVIRVFGKIDFSNFNEVITQSKAIRTLLKSFITYGMLLFLSFFTLLYTYISYLVEPRVRAGCLAILGIIFIGSIGFIVQPNHLISYRLVNHPINDIILSNAQLTIKFTEIPEDFKEDCKKALSHQMDIFIKPMFAQTPNSREIIINYNNQHIISNRDYKLSHEDILRFLSDKELDFSLDCPQAILVARDIKGSPLMERQDSCRINGNKIDIPFDKTLWFYFKLQDKNGIPVKVYY